VVDDHPIVRTGFRQVLSSDQGIEVAAEASSAEDALEQNRRGEWDLVVLDLGLPDADGIDVLQRLLHDTPGRPVLALAARGDRDLAERAMKAGATGYLSKSCDVDELLEAVRTTAARQPYVSERALSAGDNGRQGSPHQRLSNRELEVFTLLASGKRSKDIASQLALSVKTVSTYRSRVLEKLKLSTNAEIGVYAVRHGLLDVGGPHLDGEDASAH
jgi:DNA-binding NarL/FixJ family response regulator